MSTTKLYRIASKVAFNHEAVSLKQYFNQYFRLNSPFMKLLEKYKKDYPDIKIPDNSSSIQELKDFYKSFDEILKREDVSGIIKRESKKPQAKLNVQSIKNLPLIQSVSDYLKNVVKQADPSSVSRIKSKYGI